MSHADRLSAKQELESLVATAAIASTGAFSVRIRIFYCTGKTIRMYDSSANLYLEQEVLTASPAKLRWLLLQKSVHLCEVVADLWRAGEFAVADQWSLRLREILTELLSGVQGTDELAKQVADLYVFMIKELTQAERGRDLAVLAELRSLLEIETETWRLVHQNAAGAQATAALPSLEPGPLWDAASGSTGSLCLDA